MAKRFEFNGKYYNSMKELADELQVSPYYVKKILLGKTDIETIKAPSKSAVNAKPITIDGVHYPSYRNASEAHGLSVAGLKARLVENPNGDGYSIKGVTSRGMPITISGIAYPSIYRASEQLGIPPETLRNRMRRGLSDEELISGEKTPSPHDQKPQKKKEKRLLYPVTVCGETFPSLTACAEKYGISYQTILQRYHLGKRDEDLIRSKRKYAKGSSFEVILDGVRYPSIYAASKATGINYQTLHSRHKRRMIDAEGTDKDITKIEKTVICIGDESYHTIADFCKKNDISETTFYKIKHDHQFSAEETAIWLLDENKPGKYTVKGKDYNSIAEMAKDYGAPYTVVYNRIKMGWDIESALTTEVSAYVGQSRSKPIHFRGKEYPTICACANAFNVTNSQVYKHTRNGMSFEEAMEAEILRKKLKNNKITFSKVTADKYVEFLNLYEIYLRDLARYSPRIARISLQSKEHNDKEIINNYLKNPHLQNRFIIENGNIVGFIVVELVGEGSGISPAIWYIVEFFILPQYRRNGCGLRAMQHFLKSFSGDFFYYVIKDNLPAQKFWKQVTDAFDLREIIRPELEDDDPSLELHVMTRGNANE